MSINSQKVLYSKGGSSERHTPDYGVKPILKYIPKDKIIWAPFDGIESEFVKQISKTNVVVNSHIDNGEDFFEFEPPAWDIIISNPPFKGKRKFFERALSFGKAFALLMSNTWLNDSSSKTIFTKANRQLQLLMFDNRMKFLNENGVIEDKITFSSSYFCCDFLPKDLILGGKLDIPKKERKKK